MGYREYQRHWHPTRRVARVGILAKGGAQRFFFFQAEDGIRDHCVTGVQTCALPISCGASVIRPPANTGSKAGAQNFALGRVRMELTLAQEIGRASCRERV